MFFANILWLQYRYDRVQPPPLPEKKKNRFKFRYFIIIYTIIIHSKGNKVGKKTQLQGIQSHPCACFCYAAFTAHAQVLLWEGKEESRHFVFCCCMTHVPDSMLVPNRFFSSVSVDRRRVRLSTFRTELRAFILNLNICILSPVSLQYYLCKICCTLDIETMLLNVTTQIWVI